MPLITVWNWPVEFSTPFSDGTIQGQNGFAHLLREACVSAEVPGIDGPELVSVCFAGSQVLSDDRTLIIIVELLHDLPERTSEIRQHLAETLHQQALKLINKTTTHEWNVEVAVKRFDPVKDGFCV
ncbi:hypothetical protein KJ611_00165 [Patescibacteria group bacterium]|nr:hypothetical protein [Patescibacteria group bacterium]MBU1705655.1 hypothetical protein [Patescibacteria group bacterium]